MINKALLPKAENTQLCSNKLGNAVPLFLLNVLAVFRTLLQVPKNNIIQYEIIRYNLVPSDYIFS